MPLGAVGAIASAHAPVQTLRLGCGAAMVGLALLLVQEAADHMPEPALVCSDDRASR